MKQFLLSSKRMALALVATMATLSAFATTDENYYWHYNDVTAYPTGKGTVYGTDVYGAEPTAEQYAETSTVQFVVQGMPSRSVYLYAQPAEGYLFAGWYGDGGNTLISLDNPASVTDNCKISTADYDEENPNYGFEPDTVFYGYFAKVVIGYKPNQEKLGTATIDKVANDLGDEVTLTATPNETYQSVFAGWVKEGTTDTIKTNPLTLKVTEAAKYNAYFTSPYAQTVIFPEDEDGYMIYSNNTYWSQLPDNFNTMSFYGANFNESRDTINAQIAGYGIYRATGFIIYGRGEGTIVSDPESTTQQPDSANLLKPAGPYGTDITELPQNNGEKYYVWNESKRYFQRANEGYLPVGSAYLSINDTLNVTSDIIYISQLADFYANGGGEEVNDDIVIIPLDNTWGNWNGAESYTVNEDGTLTFNTQQWGGLNKWLGGVDWSEYSELVMEYVEPVSFGTQLFVQYDNKNGGDENQTAWCNAGEQKVSIALDPTFKDNVKQFALQAAEIGTVQIAKCYLVKNGASAIKNIQTIKTSDNVRYNLAGQVVDGSYKGIVIIGGKKYLVK